jgi:hypothetical protein
MEESCKYNANTIHSAYAVKSGSNDSKAPREIFALLFVFLAAYVLRYACDRGLLAWLVAFDANRVSASARAGSGLADRVAGHRQI